jgi:hypothetical protein
MPLEGFGADPSWHAMEDWARIEHLRKLCEDLGGRLDQIEQRLTDLEREKESGKRQR